MPLELSIEEREPPEDDESFISISASDVYMFGSGDFSVGRMSDRAENERAAAATKTVIEMISFLYSNKTAKRSISEISSSYEACDIFFCSEEFSIPDII